MRTPLLLLAVYGDESFLRRMQPKTRQYASAHNRRVRAIKRQQQDGS
jgi:hypothetical protein